jgi:hypothetical protein
LICFLSVVLLFLSPSFCFLVFIFFIFRFAFYSSFSFVLLRYVFLCPHVLLSSQPFVSDRWTILSPFVAKLTTKVIASDQKSSPILWQSGRISGSPRTVVIKERDLSLHAGFIRPRVIG